MEISKTKQGIIAIGIAIGGLVGGQAINQPTIDDLNVKVETAKIESDVQQQAIKQLYAEKIHALDAKQDILKRYIYAQASSCRTLAPDLTYTSVDDITLAIDKSVKDAGLDPLKIQFPMEAIKKVALEKGDLTALCK